MAKGNNSSGIDFQGSSDDQLGEQLASLKREQFNLRFQAATNQLEKPSRVREVRKDIARIKTAQQQRSVSAVAAHAAPTAK